MFITLKVLKARLEQSLVKTDVRYTRATCTTPFTNNHHKQDRCFYHITFIRRRDDTVVTPQNKQCLWVIKYYRLTVEQNMHAIIYMLECQAANISWIQTDKRTWQTDKTCIFRIGEEESRALHLAQSLCRIDPLKFCDDPRASAVTRICEALDIPARLMEAKSEVNITWAIWRSSFHRKLKHFHDVKVPCMLSLLATVMNHFKNS